MELQEHLYEIGQLPWYDVLAWATYLTHFFTVFVVAAILWRVSRPRFLEFRAMVLTLSISAFATYALFPAAPPWMASDDGLIGPVYRITGSVWSELGVHPAASIWDKGDSLYNPVAALPSLHAAFPMLLLCFFWRYGLWPRLIGIAYVLSMAWALIYGGEHYVFDVLAGWGYAAAVYFGVRWARAKWAARRGGRRLRGAPRPRQPLGIPNWPCYPRLRAAGTPCQEQEEMLQVGPSLQALPGCDAKAGAPRARQAGRQAQLSDLPRRDEEGPESSSGPLIVSPGRRSRPPGSPL